MITKKKEQISMIEQKLRKLIQYQGIIYYKTDMQTMSDQEEANGFVYLYKFDEPPKIEFKCYIL
jgi:hypothetical protein